MSLPYERKTRVKKAMRQPAYNNYKPAKRTSTHLTSDEMITDSCVIIPRHARTEKSLQFTFGAHDKKNVHAH